jgi:hypothetical protein
MVKKAYKSIARIRALKLRVNIEHTIAFTILLITLMSCKSETEKIAEKKDRTQRIVLIDKYTCKLNLDTFQIRNQDFFGDWRDSLAWDFHDGCWYGIDYLDKKIECSFFPSRKYIWREYYTDSSQVLKEQGEFWTVAKGDSNFLILAHNKQMDTLFKQGDTMFGVKYLIYKMQPGRILIQQMNLVNSKLDSTITDLVKK